jgi:AraC family transcriptional regulator
MRPSGPPASLLWRGGAAHLHPGNEGHRRPDLHAHFALQLCVSLGGEIRLSTGPRARRRSASVWLIGSDQPHRADARGRGALVFLDPVSDAGRRLTARLGSERLLAIPPPECDEVRAEIAACLAWGWRLADVRTGVDRIVELLARPAVSWMDRRVHAVLEELQRDSTDNVSLGTLAAGVGLSESRLAHLFRREVGLPMRQYRLSLRMEHAMTLIAEGRTLTEAAHTAGFADSAHFCRICRRMFGNAPSGMPRFATQRD